MFVRIVKLSLKEEYIVAFLANFEIVKHKIRNAHGNRFLELYQDKGDKTLFFTYSHWNTELDLENYRKSDFFNEVWTYTKTLFDKKPEAWSVDVLETLK